MCEIDPRTGKPAASGFRLFDLAERPDVKAIRNGWFIKSTTRKMMERRGCRFARWNGAPKVGRSPESRSRRSQSKERRGDDSLRSARSPFLSRLRHSRGLAK
jgi:hypothetical protein